MADIAAAKTDLRSLRVSLDQQNNLETQLKAELSAAGRLPDQTPQEMQLQTLSNLAAQNHLTVIRQLPLAGREYPGLLEQRFAFEVTGTLSDLARFFKAVEGSPSWTDVSFLKIDHGKDDEAGQRNAFLTFSAFSMANAPQKKLDPARGG